MCFNDKNKQRLSSGKEDREKIFYRLVTNRKPV